ncbi:hypothetical protein CCAND93_530048 [Capnocytophaga canis]|uniref:Uncharacterized protein n=1 Tax=Capnocytophaga canis TaxID=1848903 RepID=A0A0B7IPF4_9FLAO|nr:hypothetical protein CCAND93_530048 [Capnocytophaga canis]
MYFCISETVILIKYPAKIGEFMLIKNDIYQLVIKKDFLYSFLVDNFDFYHIQ